MPSEKIGQQFDKRANAYNSCEFESDTALYCHIDFRIGGAEF
jgi:hypothetical protein